MSFSVFPPISSSGAASNDFTLNLGTSGYTKATLPATFPAGSYVVSSTNLDSTLDIYLLSLDGTVAGTVNAGATSFTISPTKEFNKIVVYGGTSNEALSFMFKYVFDTSTNSTSDFISVGPRVISITPSSLVNQDDTLAVTGQNFATDVQVTFTGTDSVARNAKSIVRGSETSLTVTRPDILPTSFSPYTITATNPGVVSPISSNVNKAINAVTAGASPTWTTASSLPVYTRNVLYSTTLLASDAESSDIDYSVISGSLPDGIVLDVETGVISGTTTSLATSNITVRAVDTGGNYLDRSFTLANINPNGPIWSTASGELGIGAAGSAYSATVTATVSAGTISYSLFSGTLPNSCSLNTSTGVISGTPAVSGVSSFTIRATDINGIVADRAFSINISSVYQFALVGGGASPHGSTSSQTGRGGLGVFKAIGCGGKTISYTVGKKGDSSDGPGGGRAAGNGGGSGGGTWIKFNGTVFAAVGGGGAQAYASDYGAHGGGFNSSGGTGNDPFGSPLGQGAGVGSGGSGNNPGSFLLGGAKSSDSWGAPGGGGYYGGGGGYGDQNQQGGTPGGGGSGYLSIPSGFGSLTQTVYNSGDGVGANTSSGISVPNAGTYFTSASQGGANNTGGLRIWKDGTLILDTTTSQSDTSFVIS